MNNQKIQFFKKKLFLKIMATISTSNNSSSTDILNIRSPIEWAHRKYAMLKPLSDEQMNELCEIFHTRLQTKKENLEAKTVTDEQHIQRMYTERTGLVLAIARLAAVGSRRHRVYLVQKEHEIDMEASQWPILCIDDLPLFHISPEDLPIAQIQHLLQQVKHGSPEERQCEWKNTDKLQEMQYLMNL
jgi:hypothetical protein